MISANCCIISLKKTITSIAIEMIKLTSCTKDIKKNCFKTRILVLTFINRRDHHRKILKSIYMNILILDLNNQN